MKASICKAKGRRLQQEVAERVSKFTGLDCGKDEDIESRPMGQTGPDLRLSKEALKLFAFTVECKNQETWHIHEAIKQVKANRLPHTDWLVIFGKNNSNPVVVMDMDTFFKILDNKKVSRSLRR
jgi:hypothetical protein